MTLARRLTRWLAFVLAVALLLFSMVVFAVLRQALLDQFDDGLRAEAAALANMVEERAPGEPWELEASALEHHDQARATPFYELWMDDGTVLARSPSLGSSDLVPTSSGAGPLPDHSRGRQVVVQTPPRLDEEGPAHASGRLLTVAVARNTAGLDEQLQRLLALLAAGALITLGAATAAGRFAVRRGLAPLAELQARIDQIDDKRLSPPLPVPGLPAELAPVVTKLNALLARLADSFARERHFNADVSHELRTPLTALRSILEVTLTRERATEAYVAALGQSLTLVNQLVRLVEALLMLTDLESATRGPAGPTPLLPLVEEAIADVRDDAELNRLSLDVQVAPETLVPAEPGSLTLVLRNLVGNAVAYTAPGGKVVVTSDPSRGLWLEVRNSGPPIPADALPRIFDRFFRADPARENSGTHHGLGLSVVRAVCRQLGAEITAENRTDGWVVFRVSR